MLPIIGNCGTALDLDVKGAKSEPPPRSSESWPRHVGGRRLPRPIEAWSRISSRASTAATGGSGRSLSWHAERSRLLSNARRHHQLVVELLREDWEDIPLGFEWSPELVAEVERLHRAKEDHLFIDPAMHFAAFGLDLPAAEAPAPDDPEQEDALVAEVLRPWFASPRATPTLVADIRRQWIAEGDRAATLDATSGYALFGLRLLSRWRKSSKA
jgi:hypothetical protein